MTSSSSKFAKSFHAWVVQSLSGNTLLPFYNSHVMHALFVQYKSLGWRNTTRNKIARIIFSLLGNKFNSWLNDSKISFKGSAFLYKTSFWNNLDAIMLCFNLNNWLHATLDKTPIMDISSDCAEILKSWVWLYGCGHSMVDNHYRHPGYSWPLS